jgi:hypothetical protein
MSSGWRPPAHPPLPDRPDLGCLRRSRGLSRRYYMYYIFIYSAKRLMIGLRVKLHHWTFEPTPITGSHSNRLGAQT